LAGGDEGGPGRVGSNGFAVELVLHRSLKVHVDAEKIAHRLAENLERGFAIDKRKRTSWCEKTVDFGIKWNISPDFHLMAGPKPGG
jgi:hypothetical protein